MKTFLTSLAGVLILAFGAGSAATQTTAPSTQAAAKPPAAAAAPPAGASSADQNYVLGPGDVIEISVLGHPDFQVHARIAQDGSIQVPYLGTTAAADRTAEQLGAQLAKALEAGGYFAKPVLKVDIGSFASRYVTVLGQVGTPGLIPIDRPYRLSEILARVGGPREDAADYVEIRSAHGPERRLSIKSLAIGDDSEDPYVAANDKIFVPKADIFYISGQIHSPGAFPVEPGMTLRMAIGRAGGLTDLGSDHHVKVTGKDGRPRRLTLDDKVEAGDVINVGEKLF